MIDQTTAEKVAAVERAVDFVPRVDNPHIHDLVQDLKDALAARDEPTLRRVANEILDDATNRYLAVAEQADSLIRHLG